MGVLWVMKRKWSLLLLLLPVAALLAAWPSRGSDAFDADRSVIALRRIAHEVLRYTGDSTSRVQPPEELPGGGYRIPFESAFAFSPDTLVGIIDAALRESPLPQDYIVKVTERPGGQVVFGYAMFRSEANAMLPCLGRSQPARQYDITIRFRQTQSTLPYWLGGGGMLALALFFLYRKTATPKADKEDLGTNAPASTDVLIRVGRFRLHPREPVLFLDSEKIALTGKEHRLLCIFAARPNELVDRDQLQKEVWEDEGVIVGRSLDMFVSRLRKKLEPDPDVRLVNVHGKGWRLEWGEKERGLL
ncbi:MAG: winged helix family transcriptional regulator [Chitinophagaceae bacterium]|nr:MAG: winged helix family transcriptional regulator [Chitinophagaceae bacterium]